MALAVPDVPDLPPPFATPDVPDLPPPFATPDVPDLPPPFATLDVPDLPPPFVTPDLPPPFATPDVPDLPPPFATPDVPDVTLGAWFFLPPAPAAMQGLLPDPLVVVVADAEGIDTAASAAVVAGVGAHFWPVRRSSEVGEGFVLPLARSSVSIRACSVSTSLRSSSCVKW